MAKKKATTGKSSTKTRTTKKAAVKKDNKSDADILREFAQETDGGLLDDLEETYFVDTGNLAINFICSGRFLDGGFPGGRLTEIYGPSASSKSLLAGCAIHGAQKIGAFTLYMDVEGGISKDFFKKAAHVNPAHVVRYGPDKLPTIERVFGKMHNAIPKLHELKPGVPIVVVYDSIGVSPCEREFKEIELPETYTEAEFKRIVKKKEQPGERAKAAGKELRKILPVLAQHEVTFVVINQTRSTIDQYAPEVTAGGGKALEYYCALRLRTSAMKKITDDVDMSVGVNVRVQNKKNRSYKPFMETKNIPLLFDQGINPLGGLLSILVQARRIKPTTGQGKYLVQEPWAGGEEIIFTANKERNEIKVEDLVKCPAIVGASSAEEIYEYIAPFKEAIEVSNSENVKLEDVDEKDNDDDDFSDLEILEDAAK